MGLDSASGRERTSSDLVSGVRFPCGLSDTDIPRGLQIVGRPGADLLVLQVAHAYEQATGYGKQQPPLD